jgi:hypothetical protein
MEKKLPDLIPHWDYQLGCARLIIPPDCPSSARV